MNEQDKFENLQVLRDKIVVALNLTARPVQWVSSSGQMLPGSFEGEQRDEIASATVGKNDDVERYVC
ncbi:unnamed protein product [Toxocara canis]|uniref:Prophage protein n=1 Tax=Toxocara canis TaxID=6265 RepID=A0A183UAG8_TOXCA|nr:unnamed protein product [Toxocara canis]